jgi:ribosome-associated translation inhibitor RaiA
MSKTVENPSVAVPVEFVGAATAEEREYALEKIDSLARYAPIRTARVVILRDGDQFDARRIEARVNVRGDRLFVHASARGTTTNEVLDLVRQRLYQLLTHQRHHSRHAGSRGSALFGRRRES